MDAVDDGALADLKVIECGTGLAGAFAAKAMADLGADVVKIEPPAGDPSRATGPFPGDAPHPERSGQFLYLNANKRGVTLDLDTADGRTALGRLLESADAVIADAPAARLDELGLTDPGLIAANPGLIVTAITPFGLTGPYRDYKGGDLIAWHMGGTGEGTPFNAVSDPERQPPLRGGGYQAEYLTGWTAASATMVAVFYRAQYGQGQIVDVSQFEAVANMMRPSFSMYTYDRSAMRTSRLKAASPWIYPCKDGYISTSHLRDHWWEAIKDLMGRPDWAESEAFAGPLLRRQNADVLDLQFSEWLSGYTRAELYPMLMERGVPCFPVQSTAEVVNSPHYRARGTIVEQHHPIAGAIMQPGPSVRYSATPWQLRRPAPLLGQHNEEVLGEKAPRPPILGELEHEDAAAAASRPSLPPLSQSWERGATHEGIAAAIGVGQSAAITVQNSTHALGSSAPRIGGQGAEGQVQQSAPIPSSPSIEDRGASSTDQPYSVNGAADLRSPASPDTASSPIADSRLPIAAPLAGIRIIDFGWILSVPHCTAWLGTLGAEVIRVETNTRLDAARAAGAGGADGIQGINRSGGFNGLNFSKKSITLNVATEAGRQLALDLIRKADVVCENYATDVMDRLGLGYETLRKVKPDIVMLSGSTLGTTGPEREATGWGPNVCAYAGLPFISGYEDGPPSDLGGIWPDYGIGTMMVFALLSAVHYRRRTGRGQHVEVSMGEVVTSMIPEAVIDYTMNGRQRPRMGNRDPHMAPHGVYHCAGDDRWVAIAVDSDDTWRALCRVIGRDDLAADSDLASAAGRKQHEDDLDAVVETWTRNHTPYDVMHLLQAAGVAAGPVTHVLDLMEDPHFQERGFVVEIDHPEVGRRTAAGLPVHFSRMPMLAYAPAPCLGQHNEEIFCGLLQLSNEELQRLQETKVIY